MERQRQQARRRNLGSSLIFAALAVMLVVIAGYLWYEESYKADSPTAPPPNPEVVGRIETINVLDALIDQDLDANLGRTSVRASHLSQPGQSITVGSNTIYVFVYTSVPARESDSNDLEPETLVLTSVGTPVPGGDGPPHVVTKGNIIVILPGGDDGLRGKVDAAIASLPDVGESTPRAAAYGAGRLART